MCLNTQINYKNFNLNNKYQKLKAFISTTMSKIETDETLWRHCLNENIWSIFNNINYVMPKYLADKNEETEK